MVKVLNILKTTVQVYLQAIIFLCESPALKTSISDSYQEEHSRLVFMAMKGPRKNILQCTP